MTCIKLRFHVQCAIMMLMVVLTIQVTLTFGQKYVLDKNAKYNSCDKCRMLVESFKKGLKMTSRGKHEGGDAHWEEKKLNNYGNSEIRLIEIQENLCQELPNGKDQCHSFAEEYETELEEWFFKHLKKEREEKKDEGSSLFEYLCNGKLEVCCPEGHFGSKCLPCPGFPDNVCNGRGFCAGNGTRDGVGTCNCFDGFDGDFCDRCAKNYYQINSTNDNGDSTKLPEQCLRCDRSCSGSCHSGGPKGCHVCRNGYNWDHEYGCIDVNECEQLETNPCKENMYCSNTIGSYKCYQCHKSCKGCVAAGDHSCLECSDQYRMEGGICLPKNMPWYQRWTRYIVYLGLLISNVIIARTNHTIGWIFGLLTSFYIIFYELEFMSKGAFSSYITKKINKLVYNL